MKIFSLKSEFFFLLFCCINKFAEFKFSASFRLLLFGHFPFYFTSHFFKVSVFVIANNDSFVHIPAESNRSALVSKGAVQLFIDLLDTDDIDVQYYCAAAISNLAVDETHRAVVVKEGNHKVLTVLIQLLQSPSDKVCGTWLLGREKPHTCIWPLNMYLLSNT